MLILPKRCANPVQGATDRERRDVPSIFSATAPLFILAASAKTPAFAVGRDPPR